MINKEDLDTIIHDVTWSYEECGDKVPQNILDTLNEIKQMVRNQPTFDECIKMWKDRNAKIKINHEHLLTIYIPHKDIDKYLICINFWKTSGQYDTHIYDTEDKNVYPADIDMELHDLIHKTLKALEVEDGK